MRVRVDVGIMRGCRGEMMNNGKPLVRNQARKKSDGDGLAA